MYIPLSCVESLESLYTLRCVGGTGVEFGPGWKMLAGQLYEQLLWISVKYDKVMTTSNSTQIDFALGSTV